MYNLRGEKEPRSPSLIIGGLYRKEDSMEIQERITLDPEVMGGKPCIRGLRFTVGTLLGLLAAGYTEDDILRAYPYLEKEDIPAALSYATWRVEEREVAVGGG